MKIVYVAETSLTNKSAYTQHVVKMCDAFSQLNHDIILYLPKVGENFVFRNIEKKIFINCKKNLK